MTTWELRSDPSAWKVWRQMSGSRSQPPCASRAQGKGPDSTSCRQSAAEATRARARLDPGRARAEPETAPGLPLKRPGAPRARPTSACHRPLRTHISGRPCRPDPRVQAPAVPRETRCLRLYGLPPWQADRGPRPSARLRAPARGPGVAPEGPSRGQSA